MDFGSILNLLDGEDFEERPVEIVEFVTSEDYLNLPRGLSDYQYQLVRASTQIYKKETLINLYGEVEGIKRWKQTKKEIIFQLGKGSGKDFTSTIACAYVVYLLLCLKDPAAYYGNVSGDNIDIINIAVNAQQATNVFFNGFKGRIKNSPWFIGKFKEKAGHFAFDKNVNVYSGHSEREAWEGYNVIYVVLDEISAFALDSTSGNEQAKTAQAVYYMYRASLTSRFPQYGKLVLLSWPRYKDDFIQMRYNKVIREKETIVRTHTFKLDPDLPDDVEGNEFTIEWEEDHIISYIDPSFFALKRPSWEVNPNRVIEDYMKDFYDNMPDALGRYACMPPESIDAFFKDKAKIETAFQSTNGVTEDGTFSPMLQPKPGVRYFVHVDLARKIDHCAVSLAHVDRWEQRRIGHKMTEPAPVVKIDAVRWWTPTPGHNVNFADVREYIVSLKQRGFDLRLVTFDRWESNDMIEYLNNVGIKSENLSVAKRHYEDMAMIVQEERLVGPNIPLLKQELVRLRIMPNNKIDHPRQGSKDLADATCGAIFNAITHTPRNTNETIEVMTLSSFKRGQRNMEAQEKPKPAINPPKREMPPELIQYFEGLRTI